MKYLFDWEKLFLLPFLPRSQVRQELLGLRGRQGLHLFEFPRDGAGTLAQEIVHGIAGGMDILLCLLQHAPEFLKLGLDRAQDLPDLAAAFLQRQSAEAHLQAVEISRERGGAGNRYIVLPLELVDQRTAAHHFRVDSFKGQEEQREIRRMRRIDILVSRWAGTRARLHPHYGLVI